MPDNALRPANLLIVDDDPLIIQAIAKALQGLGRLRFATGGREALALASAEPPDLLLLDAQMPDLNGLEVLRQLRERSDTRDLQVIVITSQSDDATEQSALELGAADFLAKPVRPAVLLARVRTQLRLKQALDALRQQATLDQLTRCANRHVLMEAIEREWARALRERQRFSLLLLDVDHFKRFNDRYGHLAGDQALVVVADLLRQCAGRPGDLVARYGGEEFAVLLTGADRDGAEAVAHCLRTRLAARALPHEDGVNGLLTVSIGAASFGPDSAGWTEQPTGPVPGGQSWSANQLLNLADQALYEAKRRGRDQTVIVRIELDAGNSPSI